MRGDPEISSNVAQFVNGSQWISHMDRRPDLDKAIRARLKLCAWNQRPMFDQDALVQVAEAAVVCVLFFTELHVPSTAVA